LGACDLLFVNRQQGIPSKLYFLQSKRNFSSKYTGKETHCGDHNLADHSPLADDDRTYQQITQVQERKESGSVTGTHCKKELAVFPGK
jgi:hypothetical protein